MMQYCIYYIKKYWIASVIALLLLMTVMAIGLNKDFRSMIFSPFNNKVEFLSKPISTEKITDKKLLSNIKSLYSYTQTDSYIPSRILRVKAEQTYKYDIKKYGKDYVYTSKISWSDGDLSYTEINDLMEIIGYKLNENAGSSTTYIVNVMSVEELQKKKFDANYWVDDKGILHLTCEVLKYNASSKTKETYLEEFKLENTVEGKIEFR